MERKRGRKVKRDNSFTVHPDNLDFYRNYKPGDNFRDKVGKKRDETLSRQEPFWNTDHDSEFRDTAETNTHNAITGRGWRFPKRGERRK